MKKQINKIVMGMLGAGMIVSPVWATDYSSMTNEELSALRGTMQNAAQEEHAAFQQEWQDRLQQMTPGERQQNSGRPANALQDGSRSGVGAGSNGGGGNGGGGNGGGGNGGGGGGNR